MDRKRETSGEGMRGTQRLRGRGELGWKDSGEQSEINLDTPDGLKFAYVCVCVCMSTCTYACLCCCQLVHLGLCIGIYVCLCVLCYFDKQEHLVCAQCGRSHLILMGKDKNRKRHRFSFLAFA